MGDNIEEMIKAADERSFLGRLERLKFLNSILGDSYAPFPRVVLEYFEETKLCFYQGAFVSSIIMASATFEELFRQFYRQTDKMEKANANGLAALVDNAVEDQLISQEEADRITELRRLRNKFTHVNVGFGKGSIENKKTLLDYLLLWGDPNKETLPVEDLSRRALEIFAALVPEFCNRFWG